MPENKGRFDQFTRTEVHFLRDVIAMYFADYADAMTHGDEEIGKRLVREMRDSAHWYSDTGQSEQAEQEQREQRHGHHSR